ncbi:Hypothetical predicted protein [Octopus vulgaris]|uniref:Uncharacterized protein n=1 Tax=Octopus vulgaris TaxID=6645 RepID=A0AA36B5U1_OCTVU|nr:Hypothetical predicted protein [Octopus vulgaris]
MFAEDTKLNRIQITRFYLLTPVQYTLIFKVLVEEREYLRDQRAKIGPKGSFQFGSVDNAAVKRNQRVVAKAERLQKQIQQQQEVDLASLASTSSQDISLASSSGDDKFKSRKHTSEAYNFLTPSPRYAMKLIRGDASSSLEACLANALLLDLQAMDLLKPGLGMKQIIVDKLKLDREKDRMKVKSNEKHKERLGKSVCIGVEGKADQETLVYWEVKDENGEMKLKKGMEQEHHLTFTKEAGTESGTYLTELSRLKKNLTTPRKYHKKKKKSGYNLDGNSIRKYG